MNIATVFKQSTTTSARMSTNIHRTELSTLGSITFDNLNSKKINGQSQQATKNKSTKSKVLMESNSVLNVVQQPGNDRHRRHSLTLRDERLLKILSAPPDEPLYASGITNNTATLSGDISSGDNFLRKYEAATSSIVAVDDYENENLPPVDKYIAAISEDVNLATMTSTPPKGFSSTTWNILQRDFNSPSAFCRSRANRAINSPNCNYYSNLLQDENSINEVERSIEKPRTIQEVMKDVIVYVEVRSSTENRTGGIKRTISNLGAKVNDRLLRNTTHVVFKDGLQSTYNKAKSWNIPIVSILWFEACKKHLVLMDPASFQIPEMEKYENPELYEKTKNLHRPIPKAKILKGLKKTNDVSSLSSSTISNVSANKSMHRRTISGPIKTTPSRKSIGKKIDEKPNNTIRAMFEKQLEKSRLDSSEMSSTLSNISALDISDRPTKVSAEKSPEVIAAPSRGDVSPEPELDSNGTYLVSGSLHKRLTRRNSMTMTPTKAVKADETAEISSVVSSARKRRCTMFKLKDAIEEEDDTNDVKNGTVNGKSTVTNKTINKSVAMDIEPKPETKCNKVRELLKTELSKTPRDNVVKSKFALPDSMRRRTVYTPQAMDETKVQTSSITPISAIKRRNTMYVKANSTPIADVPDMNNSKSCDSILTPTNRPNFGADSITPLIQSLSKPHLDNIRNSSSKTLLDEYNNSFSSTKTPMTDKRRTIANITLDIIKQRLENINRNASFNQSTNDLLDESFESKSMTSTVVNTIEKPPITPTPISDGNIDPKKPLKRKLFAPPSLFPENSPTPIAVPKTDKKTVTQKRKRNDLPSAKTKDIEKTQSEKSSLAKKNISRRSTLLFEDTSMRKDAHKSNSIVSGVAAKSKVTPLPGLVFTSARKSQIDFISEVRQG